VTGDRVERLGVLIGVDGLGRRRQVAERGHDVVRGGGALERDLAVELTASRRLEREELLPEDRLDPDRRRGPGAEPGRVLHAEVDAHVPTVEDHGGHLTHLHACDADVVALLETARLGDRRRVRAPGEQRQVVDVEGHREHGEDHAEPDRPDDHGVALAERRAATTATSRHHSHLAVVEW
jgi:hypothetical protein